MTTSNKPQGKISGTGLVDLTSFKSEEDFAAIERISGTGVVLVPEAFAAAAARIPMSGVGSVIPVPTDKKVSVHTGLVRLSSETLLNADGDPDDVLVIVGQAIVTGVPAKIGYRLIVVGMLLAPKAAEPIIAAASHRVSGTVLYYEGKEVRMFMNKTSLDKDFFDLLSDLVTIVVLADVTLDPNVTVDLLRAKVAGIILMGNLTVPKHLKSLVQVLATDQFGKIIVADPDNATGV